MSVRIRRCLAKSSLQRPKDVYELMPSKAMSAGLPFMMALPIPFWRVKSVV